MSREIDELHNPILMDNSSLREINPNIALHFQASQDELLALPKAGNLIVDDNYVEWVHCPCCGRNETRQLYVKWGIQYDECPICTHVFAKNRFKEGILEDFYKTSISDELDREVNEHTFNQAYWSKVYKKYLKYIQKMLGKSAKILDVGCGGGLFLKISKRNGFRNLHGLDVYDNLIEVMQATLPHTNIYKVNLFADEASISSDFDVLTFWGVLEHLVDPIKALRRSYEALKEGGLIIALVPNINSRAFQILGVNTPTLNPRQHISFPTRKSMKYICEKTGFNIVEVLNELPVIDLMYPYINYTDELALEIAALDQSYYHVYILKK